MHVRIGPGGWRDYACTHPDAHGPLPEGTTPEKALMIGKIRGFDLGGRHIGKTEKTPDWCPFLRNDDTPKAA